jgi:hypothetical protein
MIKRDDVNMAVLVVSRGRSMLIVIMFLFVAVDPGTQVSREK